MTHRPRSHNRPPTVPSSSGVVPAELAPEEPPTEVAPSPVAPVRQGTCTCAVPYKTTRSRQTRGGGVERYCDRCGAVDNR